MPVPVAIVGMSPGGSSTLSMTWIKPFEAGMSVPMTMVSPLSITLPSTTLIAMGEP